VEKAESMKNYKLYFEKTGSKAALLFTFHGFDLDLHSWEIFSDQLEKEYTSYHFDLPFHGRSQNIGSLHSDFQQQIRNILLSEGDAVKFDLLAYSLGANFCLYLIQIMPEKINKVLLLAPDGFQRFNFKRFLNRSALGRVVSRNFIKYGSIFKALIQALIILRIYPGKTGRFFLQSIDLEVQRQELINRWAAVDDLDIDIQEMKTQLRRFEIPVQIIGGKNDSMIPPGDLLRHSSKLINVKLKDMGHNMLTNSMIDDICIWIKSDPLLRSNE
jgi:pimeloyl-ACP methyl ester carboxylesterase